ncbi:MAG: SUMF1/EgtB/PvdO family nonheme iron enzyme [Herpetosiphon sp.]|nr:SUMF1/EgtB/PvdO family nonheme iron enzyme [Herpetosiphon sp.]
MQSNHPVVNVTYYEAMAFCAWLNSFIPHSTIRLPSNSEWEVMAYYDQTFQRHNFPWSIDLPNQERAVLNHNNVAQSCTAIGVCALGIAPCCALDVIGNVWE